MRGGLSCFGWDNYCGFRIVDCGFESSTNPQSAIPNPQLSKGDPHPYLQRCEGDVIRPLPRMQVNNEERRRGEQARLGAEQPAIGPPVEGARALIELFGVAPHVPAVRPQRARVLRRPADIEQRAPLATRLAVLALGEDDQGCDACRSEPFPVVHDGAFERLALT